MSGYRISKALRHSLSKEEIEQLVNIGAVNLGWWNLVYGKSQALALSQYADGFYHSAIDLMNAFCEKRLYSDAEALPILYLVFHFMELALKASIEAKLRLLEASAKPPPRPNRDHKINALLDFLASLFRPGEEFLSEETQTFIRKMAELNGRSAQVFRYPFGKRTEQIYWDDRPVLSIGLLRAEFEIHGAELNGFQQWLSEQLTR